MTPMCSADRKNPLPAQSTWGQDIIRRTLTSVGWNLAASILQVAVGIGRSILLARLIPIEVFGVYSMAGSIVSLSLVLPGFGMADAFLHRAPETAHEDHAAAVWLTLKLVFATLWLLVVGFVAVHLLQGQMRLALLVMGLTHWGIFFTSVPQQILVRRVVHRPLAFLHSVNLMVGAITAAVLALRGAGLWALLSTDVVTLVVSVCVLYVWRPVWRPYLAWSRTTVRYLLSFGSRNLLAHLLLRALDRADDLWAGIYLGSQSLDLYSRAYAFATYPRTILASSINKVAGGTYAELATSRERLSKAFFRTNAFLVRTGFYMGGILALMAPELIRLLLGTKWLPMLTAFRFMLVFTLLDPLKTTIASLFVAVGRPGDIVKARVVQLVVMIAALFLLGQSLGIVGVALAVDLMLVVGIGILLWQARAHVDFSLWALFAAPSVALALAVSAARGTIWLTEIQGPLWRTGSTKAALFTGSYVLMLLILDRRHLSKIASYLTAMALREGT